MIENENSADQQTVKTCLACGGKVVFSHTDDAGTSWFKCEKCGQYTNTPKIETTATISTEAQLPPPPLTMALDDPEAKLSQADKLILLCEGQHPILFVDQTDTPYARVQVSSINVTMPLKSQNFKSWLSNLLWRFEQKAPSITARALEIEIEDAALTPNMIPNVLGSILEQLNSWIDAVLFKSDVKSGVCVRSGGKQCCPLKFQRFSFNV